MSPPPELDGAGTMVNCAIKTEEKKEGSPETPPGAAPNPDPRPQDPPGPPARDGSDPQALPQVGVTNAVLPCSRVFLIPRNLNGNLRLSQGFFGSSRIIPGL